jgi:hypothetical protein
VVLCTAQFVGYLLLVLCYLLVASSNYPSENEGAALPGSFGACAGIMALPFFGGVLLAKHVDRAWARYWGKRGGRSPKVSPARFNIMVDVEPAVRPLGEVVEVEVDENGGGSSGDHGGDDGGGGGRTDAASCSDRGAWSERDSSLNCKLAVGNAVCLLAFLVVVLAVLLARSAQMWDVIAGDNVVRISTGGAGEWDRVSRPVSVPVEELVGNWTLFEGESDTLYAKFEVIAVVDVSDDGRLQGNADVAIAGAHMLGAGKAITSVIARATQVREGFRNSAGGDFMMNYIITVSEDDVEPRRPWAGGGEKEGRVMKFITSHYDRAHFEASGGAVNSTVNVNSVTMADMMSFLWNEDTAREIFTNFARIPFFLVLQGELC